MGALSPATEASTWAEEVDPTLEEETHAFDDEPLDFNGEKPPEVTEFELETLDMAADKQEVTTKVVRDWRRRPNGSEEAALSGEGVPVPCPVLATGSFRDMGQNSALRRPVDSATCGPELKQSLGLKSACKEPLSGFKGASEPAPPQKLAITSQQLAGFSQHFRGACRPSEQLAALPRSSQAFRRARSTSEQLTALPSSSQHFRVARSTS